MNRQKKIASVLAGVSFLALSVAASPAMAAGNRLGPAAPLSTYTGGSVNVSPPTNQYDFIRLNNDTTVGDVVINTDLGGNGQWSDVGFEAQNGTIISGDLIINATADVVAHVTVTSPTDDATTDVASIYIHDGSLINGSIVNNGNITGYAKAYTPSGGEDAAALAFGVASLSDDNPSFINHNNVDASAFATAYNTASAIAGGVGQVVIFQPGAQTATVYNDGSIDSVAEAKSIKGHSSDDTGDEAIALGLGAGQLVLADTAIAHVTNVDGGSINVHASASVFETGTDDSVLGIGAGAGIAQIAVGDGSAFAGVKNDGTVDVNVDVKAVSTNDDAVGLGIGAGSLQLAVAYGTATADLANGGDITSTVDVYAAGLGPNDTGTAIGASLGNAQIAVSYGSGTASAHTFNSGTISAAVYASAQGDTANAIAVAVGNAQIAAGLVADTYLDNSGDITVTASATAATLDGNEAFALAAGIGVLQASVGGTAYATVINTGAIDVNVHAYATGAQAAAGVPGFGIGALGAGVLQVAVAEGNASATVDNQADIHVDSYSEAFGEFVVSNAEAAGVGQIVFGYDGSATADVTNSSLNSIDVNAQAYGSGDYVLTDGYGFGVAQVAVSYNSSASALANNSGAVTVNVDATGHGFFYATGEANAAGIEQIAYAYTTAIADIQNTGTVESTATVHSDSFAFGASANAQAIGAGQIAVSYGTASANLFNDNTISAIASAEAYSVFGYAHAYSTATGVAQVADGFTATALIRNNSTISADADAYASSIFDSAYATASAFGVVQVADGGIIGAATLYNDGSISAVAEADAIAYETAAASAYASGVNQLAAGEIGTAMIDNTGSVTASANAFASSYTSAAYATAEAQGVRQNAFGEVASGVLTNSSTIAAYATATAFAHDTAYASASAQGVGQFEGGYIASGLINNTSSITAKADAYAVSTNSTAYASASATGVFQGASGAAAASAILYNEGTISAVAHATATASDTAYAESFAGGVGQFVDSGSVATAFVQNDSSITATAVAKAVNTSEVYAYASAEAKGVGQFVQGDGVGAAVLINTSSISATATANATATGDGYYAYASAYATGVVQKVGDFSSLGQATASINNSSNITATANANGEAYYTAYASASANGTVQVVEGAVAAADLYNTGSILATANATATATSGTEIANAYADAYGVNQYGYGNQAFLSVENHGTINAEAKANASSTVYDAYAYATATGVYQYADADVNSVYLSNTSSIKATATANATGSSYAYAYAYAAGVWQEAGGDVGYLTVVNTSTIEASANANALDDYYYPTATATATGVHQDGDSDSNTLRVTNTATIKATATANASATGTGSYAYAYAYAYGVWQEADGDSANIGLVNTASIEAVANAKALVTNTTGLYASYVNVTAIGVYQDGDVDANVIADVYNEGSISAVASAYATAPENAGYYDYSAYAYGIEQYGDGEEVSLTVTNHGDISALATFKATASQGSAYAFAQAYGVYQDADGNSNIATLFNDGTISGTAIATAEGDTDAGAYAETDGVEQNGSGSSATLTVTNLGDITSTAKAYADPKFFASATASADGIDQEAESDGTNIASVYNEGSVSADAAAYATGGTDVNATATAAGVEQDADGGVGTATLTNHGDITAVAFASANATGYETQPLAYATAEAFATGAYQGSDAANATLTVTNTSNITAVASAYASAITEAYANAEVNGAEQHADSDIAALSLSNTGVISGEANALASSVSSSAYATASANGVVQKAHATLATADVYNDGTIIAKGSAQAVAEDYAGAYAGGYGVFQESNDFSVTANLSVTNLGLIAEGNSAKATSTDSIAYAFAYAAGVQQDIGAFFGSSVMMDNKGTILASAVANASGDVYDEADAVATGHGINTNIYDGPGLPFVSPAITVDNEKGALIWAYAEANANDTANAQAVGGRYYGVTLDGTIDNAGTIAAVAMASASTGSASAIGVLEASVGANNTTLTNTGVISAYAETDGGAAAYATGVAILSYGEDPIVFGASPELAAAPMQEMALVPVYPVAGLATVNNDGGVIDARYSYDGGETTHRGVAITTVGFNPWTYEDFGDAPNPVEINLTGGDADSAGKAFVIANNRASKAVQSALAGYDSWGYIHGDIILTGDDTVNVTDGVTLFDGQFFGSEDGYGDLTIDKGGKLVLLQPYDSDAQSGGYVDTLTVTSTGSLAYELTTSDAPGSYGQIDANTANLDGGIVAIYNPGLYGNQMYYDNVVSSDARTGQFATVTDNSILLDTQQVVDGNNIDLKVDRVAFNKVGGLTKNQKAVGGGIEKVYPKIDENTNFGRLVAGMFTLDKGNYQDLLDQLSGAEYANHLASVLWSTRAIDRIITERMECTDGAYQRTADGSSAVKVGNNTVTPTADVVAATGCFRQGEGNVWMSGFGQWNSLSGDQNAPGYDETQYGIIFGADYAFTDDFFAGIAGGYFNSQGDFDNFGGRSGGSIDYDGLQLAAYGGYDNSLYYLRGIVAYGNYGGDSHRDIKIPGSAGVDPSGSPDSDTWSFYGETGYRFNVMSTGQITPFLGLSLATANLDGFTEQDPYGTGAALKIHNSDANSVASVLGARFTADMPMGGGVFSPIVSVAWMHEFDDTAQQVNMSFAGAPSGASFTVTGSEVARDTAVVDVGGKFTLTDNFDMGLFYNGQFNGDYTSNSVTATLGYRF